jgi:CBS domain containing-hemolysin-like protein
MNKPAHELNAMHHQVRMKMTQLPSTTTAPMRLALLVASLAALLAAVPAQASHGSPETVDKVADVLTWVVIIIVPIVGITVFWLVHILPEKFAHKRNHPQTEAIQVLCLLSLVFGGLLWPIAWLWAFSKPVLYKMAYGTDKAEGHAELEAGPAESAHRLHQDVARLRADLERIASREGAPGELAEIRDRLAALEPRLVARAGEAR